jgi:hypothetical protein
VTAEREQWDDGNNTLALAPGVVVAYERNVGTNRALERAGIEVVRIAGPSSAARRGPAVHELPVLRRARSRPATGHLLAQRRVSCRLISRREPALVDR